MGDSIIDIIITALIPILVALVLWWFARDDIERILAARNERRREKIFRKATPQNIQEWLIDYYSSKGEARYLYKMSTLPKDMVVPFFTRNEWALSERKPDSLFVFQPELHTATVKHDVAIIKRRKKLFGQNIWNQPIFRAVSLARSEMGVQVEVGHADYYQFISACGPLADEVVFAISQNKKTPYRDKFASTVYTLETFPCKAHAIGIHTLVIGRRENGQLSTILHERSKEVAINRGAHTGAPTFTFQPHSGHHKYDRDIFHSFLREYLEELYEKKDFIRCKADSYHPKINWWYELPQIKPVLELVKQGEASFHILGLGFDLSHCDLVICACLVIENQDYWNRARAEMKKNWEASPDPFRQEHWLFSAEIDALLTKRQIQPGTAYCLDKARVLLRA